ncbi:MAG: MaoC family dehydratase [Myxococcota bacterium]
MKHDVGARATLTRIIDAALVEGFAHVTGDTNPVHLDEEFAATTRFGRRIAHGMLLGGLISNVLANDLPGRGTIYLSQTLSFKKPVFLGDAVTVTVTVTERKSDKPILSLQTVCTNQDGVMVADGVATVLAPE